MQNVIENTGGQGNYATVSFYLVLDVCHAGAAVEAVEKPGGVAFKKLQHFAQKCTKDLSLFILGSTKIKEKAQSLRNSDEATPFTGLVFEKSDKNYENLIEFMGGFADPPLEKTQGKTNNYVDGSKSTQNFLFYNKIISIVWINEFF